jgi:hypothetical protein
MPEQRIHRLQRPGGHHMQRRPELPVLLGQLLLSQPGDIHRLDSFGCTFRIDAVLHDRPGTGAPSFKPRPNPVIAAPTPPCL